MHVPATIPTRPHGDYLLHLTGKPIPQTLVDRIKKSSTFNQGFATVEYLAAALVDMKLHLAGDQKIDPDKFERETLDLWSDVLTADAFGAFVEAGGPSWA